MTSKIALLRPAASLALLVAVAGSPALAQPAGPTAWRLLQAPQAGAPSAFVWAAQADLDAPAADPKVREVRVLTRTGWASPGIASAWTIARVRLRCDKGVFQTISREESTIAGQRKTRRGGPSGNPTAGAWDERLFEAACNRAKLDGPRARDLADAFQYEARAEAG